MNKKDVLIIGGGVSGLSVAWFLMDSANVTLVESDVRLGGHANTVTHNEAGHDVAVDTGYMVFNRPNYPLLSKWFDDLGVETYPTDMSFSVSMRPNGVEYNGSDLNGLFAQRLNLVRPRFHRMIRDIMRFNKTATNDLRNDAIRPEQTLADYLEMHRFSKELRQHYLLPMAAAIWSSPVEAVAHFSARSLIRFFDNHGLMQLKDRPKWETVVNGSQSYVKKVAEQLGEQVLLGDPAVAAIREGKQWCVELASGKQLRADELVMACHSDQASRIVKSQSPAQRLVLNSVRYQTNIAVLHNDEALMPKRKAAWSSWNYLGEQQDGSDPSVSVTYWMNSLQNLNTRTNYFVTLNPVLEPEKNKVVQRIEYAHPVFDSDSESRLNALPLVQGENHLWVAGAWTGYGFHEDGMRSGVEVAHAISGGKALDKAWLDALIASRDLIEQKKDKAAA